LGLVIQQDRDNKIDTLEGTIEQVAFRNRLNGFIVARLKAKDQTVTITGQLPNLTVGEYIELSGHWTRHQTYGRQFNVAHVVPLHHMKNLGDYLAKSLASGVGPKTAEKIVNHFKDELLNVLDHTPHRLVEVPTIGRKKALAIQEAWQVNRHLRDAELFLFNHGISGSLAQRILKTYGSAAIEELTTNPYQLAWNIKGVGFLTADKIAQSIGIKADSDERIKAGILHCLEQSAEVGHCYQTEDQMVNHLTALLAIDANRIQERLPTCANELVKIQQLICFEDFQTRCVIFALPHLFEAERKVVGKIRCLLKEPKPSCDATFLAKLDDFLSQGSFQLSDEQKEGVILCCTHRVSILTGGPGVGKTTTANAIIGFHQFLGRSIALCAPTGRAAQRLAEVSGQPALTIHRLLEWSPAKMDFVRNDENPINAQVIVVDESSMIDIELAAKLLDAVKPSTQILFIGDSDQLPSVGPGNFLRDLIESKLVPTKRLNKIFRQAESSHIIKSAHAINQGELPEFSNEKESNCKFVEIESPSDILGAIIRLTTEILPKQVGYDPVRDIQVLTPMNRGDLGTKNLNRHLQHALNPSKSALLDAQDDSNQTQFRQHDKVIQTANDYDLSVFNGDIGLVSQTEGGRGKTLVSYGDRMVSYDSTQIGKLRLAYAITIHKSQGSEFPVVIIPLATQHFIMLQRNLIYTALTRAKKLAVFIGSKKALKLALGNPSNLQRQTRVQLMLSASLVS
jgi:exodeoxyribonuclease V alpha subunit